MICPECFSADLKEISYNPKTKDITYECQNCHEHLVVTAMSDAEVYSHDFENTECDVYPS